MEINSHSDFEVQVSQQVTFWQQTLRLQDWTLDTQFWPHDALDGDIGRSIISRNQKSAIIALRYPEDLPPIERDCPGQEACDYDMTIVHELLHIMFVDMECKHEWAEEQSCNLLSRALVNLYRGNGQLQVPHPSPPVGDDFGHPGHYL
jgi:hypothetical protein